MILCVPALDLTASFFDVSIQQIGNNPVTFCWVLVYAICGVCHLPFDSWCTSSWLRWPHLNVKPNLFLNFMRLIKPFRLVHGYGVFPADGFPAQRHIPVLEGSMDGISWKKYRYNYQICEPTTKPPLVGSLMPRFDFYPFYSAHATVEGFNNGLFTTSSITNATDGLRFKAANAFHLCMKFILEGKNKQIIGKLFKEDPFPNTTPKYMRCRLYIYTPTTIAELQKSGAWWNEHLIGTYMPSRTLEQLNDTIFCYENGNSLITDFNWDCSLSWRNQVPLLASLHSTFSDDSSCPSQKQAEAEISKFLLDKLGIKPNQISQFWEFTKEFPDSVGLDDLKSYHNQFVNSYDGKTRASLKEIFSILRLILGSKLEKYFFEEKEEEGVVRLDVPSYFHLSLVINEVIAGGPDMFYSVLCDPCSFVQNYHVHSLTWETGLFYWGLFWFDILVIHAISNKIHAGYMNEQKLADNMPKAVPNFLRFCGLLASKPNLSHDDTDILLPTIIPPPPFGTW
eukprot:CAMPEP_0174256684 /NCGR_PEP_ID=MMETSP0439-20130205/5892_1 /TAXON_ID=0 /ORGANISM="Stereomyxa ramosa, Strain Chinc5" /LENGTH=508 /DNA_ID=CAMNT_0015339405 /DNA_START=493 /DNA_END=2016 /DNA_ORIENTATION=+